MWSLASVGGGVSMHVKNRWRVGVGWCLCVHVVAVRVGAGVLEIAHLQWLIVGVSWLGSHTIASVCWTHCRACLPKQRVAGDGMLLPPATAALVVRRTCACLLAATAAAALG